MINYTSSLEKIEFLLSFCISLRKKFLYAPIPKVAHTTIKKTLFTLEMSEAGLTYEGNVHDCLASPFILPYQLPDSMLHEIFLKHTYFKFTFIRNPIDRIASGYLDKISNTTNERKIERAYFEKMLGADENTEITLVDFLSVLRKTPPDAMDLHFKPQSDVILSNTIDYDFIGSMDSLDTELPMILSKIYNKPYNEIQVTNVTHHATNASNKIPSVFTEQRAYDLAEEIYKDDFKLYQSVISKQ
ncbi:sulfotransferase family protein [Desulfovibrio inopinatus]|uniref:sulfotransferase family protein n=1 Tax=Desulfovibrio inopinatus TaxID=102109 RepID=UPI00048196CE|nr:sulfotransferase family protein [Desulfovibrio inopinatus]